VHAGFTASSIDFDWKGTDEGDQVQGTGWADLRDDGHLDGEIAYDNGHETAFIAEPWPFPAACEGASLGAVGIHNALRM